MKTVQICKPSPPKLEIRSRIFYLGSNFLFFIKWIELVFYLDDSLTERFAISLPAVKRKYYYSENISVFFPQKQFDSLVSFVRYSKLCRLSIFDRCRRFNRFANVCTFFWIFWSRKDSTFFSFVLYLTLSISRQ